MSSLGRLVVAVTSLAALGVAAVPCAGQVWVRVPRRGGEVYVPLDPSGRPVGVPDPGAVPSGRLDAGFLLVEIEPPAASVYVDGHPIGTAEAAGDGERVLALAPGPHRVDVVHPGFVPLTAAVVVVPRHTSVLRSRLTPERDLARPGSGYSVVPVP